MWATIYRELNRRLRRVAGAWCLGGLDRRYSESRDGGGDNGGSASTFEKVATGLRFRGKLLSRGFLALIVLIAHGVSPHSLRFTILACFFTLMLLLTGNYIRLGTVGATIFEAGLPRGIDGTEYDNCLKAQASKIR